MVVLLFALIKCKKLSTTRTSPNMRTNTIFIIRHAETTANVARVVQSPDTPLSEWGVTQAESVAQRLAHAGITTILSSDLLRAVVTAKHLQATTGAALHLDPNLQERNYGDVRGCAYEALDTDIFAPGYQPPGGESWDVFHHPHPRCLDHRRRDCAAHARESCGRHSRAGVLFAYASPPPAAAWGPPPAAVLGPHLRDPGRVAAAVAGETVELHSAFGVLVRIIHGSPTDGVQSVLAAGNL